MLGEAPELLPPTHTDHLERCTRAEGGQASMRLLEAVGSTTRNNPWWLVR